MPGLEILAESVNNLSSEWGFIDYAKSFGIGLLGALATYVICRVRRREMAREDVAKSSEKSAARSY